ncbi:uncharacterized protein LOC107407003 [Ziziphus jujuba]|uniref:Uncharacterized protein LOC107407003 n=1 Tax=Ziziphus jujuba TaxID=326968 RepID=A0ABM3IWR4_ZIZJJ|nr:uncharacterized protein LOC107407003 [Ziziphus jujuba]
MAVAQISASLSFSIRDVCTITSAPTPSRLSLLRSARTGTAFATGSPLILQRSYHQRKPACNAMRLTIRCEQNTQEGNSLDVWLGRFAMVGFAAAISVEIGTGKGLLENFGLTSPLPTVALAVTALVGVLTAVFIFQSASKNTTVPFWCSLETQEISSVLFISSCNWLLRSIDLPSYHTFLPSIKRDFSSRFIQLVSLLIVSLFMFLFRGMGTTISRLAKRFFTKNEMKILMVGLDASGKTTILYKLKLGATVATIPTIGFNTEAVEYKSISFTIWDAGGRDKIRPLWRQHFQNAQGLIFVVDSNDRERVAEARNELHRILNEKELSNVILLVFANKQDLPNSMPPAEVADQLGLHSLKHRPWYIQSTSAASGEGLYEGLEWLSENILTRQHDPGSCIDSSAK